MNVIFSTLLEMLAASAALIPMFFLMHKILFHNAKKSILYCIFSFYLVAVYVLVGMPNITYVRLDFKINIIPFVDFAAAWKSSILNVLLFVPLGFFLPMIWNQYRAGKNTVLFGLGMSLAIEILQIFTYRATDINDLITNGLGTFVGFCIADILMKKYPILEDAVKERKASELRIVCATTFAVMFLIQPFVSSILWELIY